MIGSGIPNRVLSRADWDPILQFTHNLKQKNVSAVKNDDDPKYLIGKVLEVARYDDSYTWLQSDEGCYSRDYGSHQCFFKLLLEGGTHG
ncbi:hypothetical protein [Staphylococcus phage vB_SauH_DELF3]|nr:hypothetical protein [Staphylococcus phage vB_SauH_DELF3]